MVFSIQSKENPIIEKIYERSMEELGDFFELNWKENKPKVFLVKDEKTINDLWNNNANDYMAGWVDNLDVYVVDRGTFKKKDGQEYSDDAYHRLIKHELTHSFTKVVAGIYERPILPDWLWEGLALYLAGQNNPEQIPEKFENFLDFYEQDMENTDVYKESGFAVEHLVKEFGKEKILDLIKRLKNISSEEDFNQTFRKIYGLELKYSNF